MRGKKPDRKVILKPFFFFFFDKQWQSTELCDAYSILQTKLNDKADLKVITLSKNRAHFTTIKNFMYWFQNLLKLLSFELLL